MNYFKQILYELKNQRMVTWVSISGTALAIFLIMAVFMADRLQGVSIPPLTNRDRILSGQGIEYISGKTNGSSMNLNRDFATKLYADLDGVERLSYISDMYGTSEVGLANGNSITVQGLRVDNEYWNIYDYKFISGKPFEKEEIEAKNSLAILTESVAREIYGETNVAGREVEIDTRVYTIKGVVEDPFALLPDGTVKFFITNFPGKENHDFVGDTQIRILLKEPDNADHVKSQVKHRYDLINQELTQLDGNQTIIYHLQPYTSAELSSGTFGSNNDPKLKFKTRLRAIIYVILLLLPAINLAGMTRSRLMNRISEIGVRRAFGAKRKKIISQIFVENLLLTFIGGAIGLCLSLIYLAFLSGYFVVFNDPNTYTAIAPVNLSPVIWHVFDFSVFFIAFGACFILNVMSASLPAWKASAVEPALAIAKSK